MAEPYPLIPILLGADLNAYSMACAFHRAYGCLSHTLGREPLGATERSHILIPHTVPHLDRVPVAVRALGELARQHPHALRVLVPCADWYMELLQQAREQLSDWYAFHIPEWGLWRRLSNKASFYATLREAGIPFPETECLTAEEGEESVRARAGETLARWGVPAILKPADSVAYWRYPFSGMQKVYTVRTADEVVHLVRRMRHAGYAEEIILQRRISGGRVGVLTTFSDRQGRVVRAVRGDVLLEEQGMTSCGNHAAILTQPLTPLDFRIVAFLEKLGYTGIANLDLISDGEGHTYLLELNPRQGRSADHVRAAGVNLASLLVSTLCGVRLTPDFHSEAIVWHSVPWRTVRACVREPNLLAEAERRAAMGRRASPYEYACDLRGNPLRRLYVQVHAAREHRRFCRGGWTVCG